MPSENPFENHAEKTDKFGLRFASVFVVYRLGREACALRPVVRQLAEGAFLLQVVARMFVGTAFYQRVAMP